MTVAGIMYKGLGISNTAITAYTSLLYLPWVVKPLWSPVVDIFRTRRLWIWTMQLSVAAGLLGVAIALRTPQFLAATLVCFWFIACASATHDIAADGFYMLATTEAEQSFFSGIRNTCYRVAIICGQGLLVYLAGRVAHHYHAPLPGWCAVFLLAAASLTGFGLYHCLILPHPAADQPGATTTLSGVMVGFVAVFESFFQKPKIGRLLLFLLFYRFAEGQLVKMAALFLYDSRANGGLGLTTGQVGLVYGMVGVAALTAGGIVGGILVANGGLRVWLWPMALIMHLPDAAFLFLAWAQPSNLFLINCCVAVEQFGYGFGFTAYMLYMIYIARGEHRTAHYAICTGFMALGMMLAGYKSGWIADHFGYRHFFEWVMLSTIPGFLVVWLVPLDPEFGKREAA
jgi:PAT family beta-lactamase induction signal transducer AmpG